MAAQTSTSRLGWLVLGWLLLVAGVAAMILPGPGLLLLAGGLAILSHQYAWAERRLGPVRAKAFAVAAASVKTWRSLVFSIVLAAVVMAIGVVWGLRPGAPRWWPLSERWWLPGGWGTGSSLIGSGIVAVGLLIYSYRRFRRPDNSAG